MFQILLLFYYYLTAKGIHYGHERSSGSRFKSLTDFLCLELRSRDTHGCLPVVHLNTDKFKCPGTANFDNRLLLELRRPPQSTSNVFGIQRRYRGCHFVHPYHLPFFFPDYRYQSFQIRERHLTF